MASIKVSYTTFTVVQRSSLFVTSFRSFYVFFKKNKSSLREVFIISHFILQDSFSFPKLRLLVAF